MPARRDFDSVGNAGFTLIELVAVISVAAMLVVIAVPRLNQSGFSSRSFADRVRESLQYAQKTAIAQRRNVCVTRSGNSLTLTRAASNGDAEGCRPELADASGNNNFVLSAPGGVTLGGETTLIFGSQGQPLSGGGAILTADTTLTVNGDYSATITIEKITGLIR